MNRIKIRSKSSKKKVNFQQLNLYQFELFNLSDTVVNKFNLQFFKKVNKEHNEYVI